jgi:hypothetical protein
MEPECCERNAQNGACGFGGVALVPIPSMEDESKVGCAGLLILNLETKRADYLVFQPKLYREVHLVTWPR